MLREVFARIDRVLARRADAGDRSRSARGGVTSPARPGDPQRIGPGRTSAASPSLPRPRRLLHHRRRRRRSRALADAARARLRDDGIAIADPRIIATTGWTTDELYAAMDAAEPLGEYDLVSLLIGVNNQYRGRDRRRLPRRVLPPAGARDRAGRRRADRVLVLSIPDWGVTPFAFASGRDRQAIADELDAFNAAARELCDAAWPSSTSPASVAMAAASRTCWPTTACIPSARSTRAGRSGAAGGGAPAGEH